jgi:hypothetical protein
MALVNLQTDLKSLKFGKDRPGGGSSNQPYIEKPLNLDLPPALDFLGNDFILRGGPVGAPLATANDVARLTKYFTDFKTPSGLLFVAKQNLLSRTAVKTQTSGLVNEGIYTPLSTLAQAGVSAFGLHLNKQGLNPFEETGAYATNNDNLYMVKVTPQQSTLSNRLIQLYGTKFLTRPNSSPNSRFLGMNDISADPQILISYDGGPGSDLGVGKTNIRLTNPTLKINYATDITDPTVNYLTLGYRGLNSVTNQTLGSGNASVLVAVNPNAPIQLADQEAATDELQLDNPRRIKGYVPALSQQDFRDGLRQAIQSEAQSQTTLMSLAPSYGIGDNQTIENRVNLGDPGNSTNKNVFSYVAGAFNEGSLFGAASPNSYDKINVYPLYQSENVTNDPTINDLVKFRIGVINNNNPSQKTYIHFRAFLDQISDQYTSDWDPTQYIGRGEKFYTYKGFDRKVSLSWTVAAQSKAELIPMYKKLNYLASVCAPDYSGNGYMRGNIVTLTIGGYFYEQPGLITGFSYEMNEENATWEIGITDDTIVQSDSSVKELPHLIKVTGFNFIPIHTFVPRKVQGTGNFNVNEKYISLQSITNNYDPENSPDFRRLISFAPPTVSDDDLGEDIPNI